MTTESSAEDVVKATRGRTSEEEIASTINDIVTESSNVVVRTEMKTPGSMKVILKTSLSRSEQDAIDGEYKILEVGGVNLPSGKAGTGLLVEI